MLSVARTASAVCFVVVVWSAAAPAQVHSTHDVRNPDAGFTVANIAGLYQMLDPRGYADPLTAATYLRLLPDGRSRLEGVIVSDVNGSIDSKIEVGSYHRNPWQLRSTLAGEELCFDVAGKSHCAQVERDLATNDLLLFDIQRPRGHADLRLHQINHSQSRIGMN
jgi:hypothetical protein